MGVHFCSVSWCLSVCLSNFFFFCLWDSGIEFAWYKVWAYRSCFGQLLVFCSVDLHWSRTLGSSECSAANWMWELEHVTSLLHLSFSLSSRDLSCSGCWSPKLWCCRCRLYAELQTSWKAFSAIINPSWFCSVLVPCPNLYVQLNGLMLTLDTASMLWINLFCLDLYRSLEQFKAIYKLEDSGKRDEHFDVRLDGFRLKVPFTSQSSVSSPFLLCKEHETRT